MRRRDFLGEEFGAGIRAWASEKIASDPSVAAIALSDSQIAANERQIEMLRIERDILVRKLRRAH